MKISRLTLLLATGLSSVVWAQNATLIRASDLKAKPFIDAASIAQLPEQTRLTVVANEGGWSQVRTSSGATGWVRLLHVRLDKQGDAGAGIVKSLGTLGNVARTGSTGQTATTGAKGISKDDLAQAAPNFQEVKRLEQYRASTKEAERYAKDNRLKAQEMSYLDASDGQRN